MTRTSPWEKLELFEPVVVPPALLDGLNQPRIEFATLHDFNMTVIAQQNRQADAREDQQQADMKYQETRLGANTLVGQQRCEQIHNENDQRHRGDARADLSIATPNDGEHCKQGHPEPVSAAGMQVF